MVTLLSEGSVCCRGRLAPVLLAFLVAVAGNAGAADAAPQFPISAESKKCAALIGFHFGPGIVESASIVPASGSEPEHCKVLAYKAGRPIFQMRALLPSKWDGNLLHEGTPGLKGALPGPLWNATSALEQNLAVIGSNGGSDDPSGAELVDPEVLRDYSYGSLSPTAQFGQSLARAYYGTAPQKKYFMGCAGGGTDGLKAAVNDPDDYDGIISQAPTTNRNDLLSMAGSANSLPKLSDAEWNAINEQYIARCDALDGLTDGIVGNPGACTFDPTTVAKWSPDQLRTIRSTYNDMRLQDGTLAARRLAFGPDYSKTRGRIAAAWGKYVFAKDEPNYDPAKFDVDKYWPKIVSAANMFGLNVDPIALAGFLKSGKKIILMMGLDDAGNNSIYGLRDFYDSIRNVAGESRDNIQLWWLAGVGHCGVSSGNPDNPNLRGPDTVEILGALRGWVEKGVRPTALTAYRKGRDGAVTLSRPICMAGQYPKYNGSGDPKEAKNFTCVHDPKAL